MPLSGITKRKPEVIDLSAGNDQQPRKIPRSTGARRDSTKPQLSGPRYVSSSQSYPSSVSYDASQYTDATALSQSSALGGSSYSRRDLWLDEANELDVDEVIMMTQDADGNSGETFELYGTILNKVVGIRYYNGYATIGEHVIIQRDPSNQYDSNAIQVNNVRREQIGHLPRTVVSKLAPYIDRGDLVVSGVLIGERGEFDCPIAVHLYGTSEPVDQLELRNRMRSDKLPLDALTKKERETKKQNTEAMKQVAMKKKLSAATSNRHRFTNSLLGGALSPAPVDAGPSLESTMLESQRINPREVGEVVEKLGVREEALSLIPMVDTPLRLRTELLPYQKQGLA